MRASAEDPLISDMNAGNPFSSNSEHGQISASLLENQIGLVDTTDGGLAINEEFRDNAISQASTGLYSTMSELEVANSSNVSESDIQNDSLNHQTSDTPDTPVVTFETEQEKRGSIRRVSMVNFMVGTYVISGTMLCVANYSVS